MKSDKKTADLFPSKPKPPKKPRQLMYMIDGRGGIFGVPITGILKCYKCKYKTDWVPLRSFMEGEYGKPCPHCNKEDLNVRQNEYVDD